MLPFITGSCFLLNSSVSFLLSALLHCSLCYCTKWYGILLYCAVVYILLYYVLFCKTHPSLHLSLSLIPDLPKPQTPGPVPSSSSVGSSLLDVERILGLPPSLLQMTEDQLPGTVFAPDTSVPFVSLSPPLDHDDYLWGLDEGDGVTDFFDTYDLGDLLRSWGKERRGEMKRRVPTRRVWTVPSAGHQREEHCWHTRNEAMITCFSLALITDSWC